MRKDTIQQAVRSAVSVHRFIRVSAAAVVVSLLLAAAGCEAVFTYSPFSELRRNPDSMSAEQKTAYAAQALESSDTEAVEDAYAMVTKMLDSAEDEEKKELLPLAVELALKDSGASEIVLDTLLSTGGIDPENPDAETDPDAIYELLDQAADGLKDSSENFTDAAANIIELQTLSPGAVTVDQCVLTAVGLLLTDPGVGAAIEDPTIVIDPDSTNIAAATELLDLAIEIQESGGGSSEEISALLGMFGALDGLTIPGDE